MMNDQLLLFTIDNNESSTTNDVFKMQLSLALRCMNNNGSYKNCIMHYSIL